MCRFTPSSGQEWLFDIATVRVILEDAVTDLLADLPSSSGIQC